MMSLHKPTAVCEESALHNLANCPCCTQVFELGDGVYVETLWRIGPDESQWGKVPFCSIECVLIHANPFGRC